MHDVLFKSRGREVLSFPPYTTALSLNAWRLIYGEPIATRSSHQYATSLNGIFQPPWNLLKPQVAGAQQLQSQQGQVQG